MPDEDHDGDAADLAAGMRDTRSDCRRRTVRQMLFGLPFVVDPNWEVIEATYERLGGGLQ